MSLAEPPDPSPTLTISCSMSSYNCFRDGCDQKFGSQRAWSQHICRKHSNNPGTSLLTQLVLDHQDRKRRRAEQDEAQQVVKRRELEVLQELSSYEPAVCLLSHITCMSTEQGTEQVPLLEQPVDETLHRSRRAKCLPRRFLDFVPGSAAPSPLLTHFQQQQEIAAQGAAAAATAATEPPSPEEVTMTDEAPAELHALTTRPDVLGVFRNYPCVPSREPPNPNAYAGFSPASWINRAPIASNLSITTSEAPPKPAEEGPGFAKACWSARLNSGSPYKSCSESNKITQHFTNPAWNWGDFIGYNAFTESRRFDREHFSKKAALKCGDEWKEANIDIPIPCIGHRQKEADALVFTVKGLLYRDLVGVITEQLKDPDAFKEMFLQPFSEHWKPTENDPPVRVYGEVYSSDAMLNAQQKLLQKLRDLPRPQPEAFLVALMLASDSTFLTQFSQASMWPIYMFFGNVSKYTRCAPDSLSAHHITYLPKVCHHLVPLARCSEYIPD